MPNVQRGHAPHVEYSSGVYQCQCPSRKERQKRTRRLSLSLFARGTSLIGQPQLSCWRLHRVVARTLLAYPVSWSGGGRRNADNDIRRTAFRAYAPTSRMRVRMKIRRSSFRRIHALSMVFSIRTSNNRSLLIAAKARRTQDRRVRPLVAHALTSRLSAAVHWLAIAEADRREVSA